MTGRRATSLRSGSRAQSTRPTRAAATANAATATQADQSNPDLGNPSLPDVRTQQSFAYGSTKTPALPRQLEVDPSMGLSEMVDTLDDGLRQAQDRELARVEDPRNPSPERRQTRSMSLSMRSSMSPAPEPASRRTPSRRTTATRGRAGSRRAASRQPTPEGQLLESLREVSEETENVKQEEEEAYTSTLPDTPSFNDSASISWTTERAIHGTLPREVNTGTRPNYYLRDPYGSRPSSSQGPSGLSFPPTRRPIFEESFPANPHLSGPVDASRAAAPTAVRRTLPPVPAFNQLRDEPRSKSTTSSTSSASNHTPSSSTHSSPVFVAATPAAANVTSSQKRLAGIAKTPSAILVIIGLFLTTFLAYFCRNHACAFPHSLQTTMSHYLCRPTSSFIMDNSTSMYADAFHKLSSHVDQRLSDMAKDVATLKNEWNRRLPHLKEALSRSPAAATDPLAPPKVNYASVGMGAVVDPYLTSPTMSTSAGLVSRIGQYLAKVPRGSPPVAALQPWDGVGECWCAATRSNVSQLTILLGRPIVPEEVVVEHIPKGATLDPGSAPREMELWAQYTARQPAAAAAAYPPGSSSSNPPSSPSSAPGRPPPPPYTPPYLRSPPIAHLHPSHSLHYLLPSRLRDAILTTLRQVYPDEPTTAYSEDALLGPSFFRVGRWQYNIHGDHHIQRFELDAVIDMPAARVEKVVFRVKSNWGAAHTCLYRVRLHGHL
ncbi:hypothetical protein BDBG_01585 [Blastomyces gilchristii SLH14081]|uniref:SUN domain-containing protein n=1 Tax=Blastomyces gilchristii (strain SLH14081) TaxID=559298 RepID=A0A179UBD3_BLAGS|nr:uncharacterized protein BDBG_01585 [Blastomyces gilchristii SLH14081]OAT05150.1 hypothetical protein BDBG_01585 [Blastomyces gilchristii SLH14081]